jgi:hypothetical protein
LLVAAGVLPWGADAMAQTAVFPDPFAPRLQTDPRSPPRFQRFNRAAATQPGLPADFTAPAWGAGTTGFDSTNSRRKNKSKTKPGIAANPPRLRPGMPVPAPVSPYDKSTIGSAGAADAQAAGAPPVELGPIRRAPKRRKAHTEPDDPYAPLGVHDGAFTLFPARTQSRIARELHRLQS